jgi:polyhydroxyalkanoate synthesis repressor PhaR
VKKGFAMAKKSKAAKQENDDPGSEDRVVTIKKYANRRLYNTATSSYVTLDDLSTMVKEGVEFVVYDAKTGEDITRSVLTHIIVEEEAKGQNLLPIGFLRHVISFYGDSLQSLVPEYLEHSMKAFARDQEQMRDFMTNTLEGLSPFGQLEDMGKQNMELFENAMKMFSPFSAQKSGYESKAAKSQTARAGAGNNNSENQIDELRARLDRMQKELEVLSRKEGEPSR